MNTPQDALLNVSARLCERDDWSDPMARPDIKRLVAIGWKQMTLSERNAFISRLDDRNRLTHANPISSDQQADLDIIQMLKEWHLVIANVSADDKSFALSIMKKRGTEGWWPTERQTYRMGLLWKERSISGDWEAME